MDKVMIYHDRAGNTLTVWFGEPEQEHICEETGDEVILMKDAAGKVIGFEKLNFTTSQTDDIQVIVDSSQLPA
jgi:uncharacterized protein YuzE